MLDQLRALDEEAQGLKTECNWRNQEIDNIRTSIVMAIGYARRSLPIPDLDTTLLSIKERLQELRNRPDWAGNHEQFKT